MRIFHPLWGLLLALAVPATLLAQDNPPSVATPTVAAAKKQPVKKRAVKRAGPPAKELFGAAKTPAPMEARAIGFYAKGCLAGAAALPVDGEAWQAMRLSRNRNWGHPKLVALVQKLAIEAKSHDGWPGLLVGDLSQPRGGPMLSGHASHQVGLDADIWLTPMPDRRLTRQEREDLAATSMLADDKVSVDPKIWTNAHARLIKRAASYPAVERIFVHPAIKKALCEGAAGDKDHGWLRKVRAYWGHHYHFHIRIGCPVGSGHCEAQPALPADDGCGAELKNWLALVKPKPKPEVPVAPSKPAPVKPGITLDQLPAECKAVLASGSDSPLKAAAPAGAAKSTKQAATPAPVKGAAPAAADAGSERENGPEPK
jgi:penicillin-insensitive murein endopeptidase